MSDLIVVDQYCGGGGTVTGLKRAADARGLTVDVVAINHSPEAIATHSRNHPDVRHIQEAMERVAPRDAVPGGRADLLCSSPSCTGYSTAKGGKPVNNQERMGPYQVTDWCAELDVRTVFVENVPEIRRWGPRCTRLLGHDGACRYAEAEFVPVCGPAFAAGRLDHDWQDGRCGHCGAEQPCDAEIKERVGEFFQDWLRQFARLGYRYEYRIVNAADHGAATSRRRFYLKARKDGLPIPWAAPTHAPRRKAVALGLKPWRPAREVLDLDDRGTSLFNRAKPLSRNTRLRIARGLLEFCGPLGPLFVDLLDLAPADLAKLPKGLLARPAGPFVVANRMHNTPRSLDEPLPAATTAHGGGALLVQPFLLGQHGGGVARSADEPMPTLATDGAVSVVQPFLVAQRDSWDGHQHVPGKARGVASDPLQTITADPGISLVQPDMRPFLLGQRESAQPKPVDAEPLPTVTSIPYFGLVQPHLDVFYGTGQPDSVDEPLSTLTTKARHGLVSPVVVPYGPRADARSAEEPLPTILTKDRLALAQPMIVPYHNPGASGVPHAPKTVDDPLGTITTEPRFGLASPGLEPFLVPNFGERDGQPPRVHPTSHPLPAVTGRGAGNLIQPAVAAAAEATGVDPRRLVWIDGRLYVLNLFYRMLRVRELARGMGFGDDYWFAGGTRDATRMIGNAVEVSVAEAELGVILDSLFPAALGESVA